MKPKNPVLGQNLYYDYSIAKWGITQSLYVWFEIRLEFQIRTEIPRIFQKIRIRIPDPDNPESGFFKSCRARYELSIRTLDAKLSFGGNWVQPEEISGPKFYRISPIGRHTGSWHRQLIVYSSHFVARNHTPLKNASKSAILTSKLGLGISDGSGTRKPGFQILKCR